MEFELINLDDKCNLVRLIGRMDSSGVDGIETRFIAALVAGDCNAVIDLSGVNFLASMGIRLFITNARAMNLKGRRIAVFGATEPVQSVLEAVALDQIIPVLHSQQEAVQALAG